MKSVFGENAHGGVSIGITGEIHPKAVPPTSQVLGFQRIFSFVFIFVSLVFLGLVCILIKGQQAPHLLIG